MHSEHEIILIGDRVLIDPDEDQNKTPSGLFLPPGVKEKEKVQGGFIVKTGPGFPIPHTDDIEDEPWEEEEDEAIKAPPAKVTPGKDFIDSVAADFFQFDKKWGDKCQQ